MPTRWLQRLADEFDDDGIGLPADPEFCRLVLEELDHCRRAPMLGAEITLTPVLVTSSTSPARAASVKRTTP
jgi:hypothetical protein